MCLGTSTKKEKKNHDMKSQKRTWQAGVAKPRAGSAPGNFLAVAGTGKDWNRNLGLCCLVESKPPSASLVALLLSEGNRAGQDCVIHQSVDAGICWLIGNLGFYLFVMDSITISSAECAEFNMLSQTVGETLLEATWEVPGFSH